MLPEEWRKVDGFPRYSVSSHGRVRNDTRTKRGPPGKHLMPILNPYYYSVGLYASSSTRYRKYVHILVCEAFHGHKPSPKHEAAHWDGINTNNYFENLRWALPIENAADKLRHGTVMRGESVPNSILIETDIPAIRQLIAAGSMQKDVATLYGVSKETISQIHRKTRWGWVN
jgi:hypothetical protein